jgi:hypothetical protein
METELVKMSPKGQLVVSQDTRNKEKFNPGDRFMQFPINSGVLFKKVKIPDVKVEFEKLSKEIEKQFKKRKIIPQDVDNAIKCARKN